MNERQYIIVDGFLKMGATPQAIAKNFKIDVLDVTKVGSSAPYEQYKSDDSDFSDIMKKMFGGAF